jgi:hypothetical protein
MFRLRKFLRNNLLTEASRIDEAGPRRRITISDAKRRVSSEEWATFLKKLKDQHPQARPSFWSDGGQIYAQIADAGGHSFLSISGQYYAQD